VREPDGIETPPPGKSSERSWSKRREPDIRNVEAEGSSPFTSTKSPGQRAEVGSPTRSAHRTCLYVSLRGSEESADARYVSRRRGRLCESAAFEIRPVEDRRPDVWHGRRRTWVLRALY
jgi:hypothetical protein